MRAAPVRRSFPAMETAIRVHGLKRSFGDVEAVAGVDLEVGHGEIFAFLGPNGAGKTTTIEILEGFGERDAGEVRCSASIPPTPPRTGASGSGS